MDVLWQPTESPLFERAEMHPRPQFTRARWTDLNGPWGFAYDDGDIGLKEDWPRSAAPFSRTITVPFPPESPASGIGDRTYHPIVWYRRTFRLGPNDKIERLLLHFGAVDYRSRVWVNGQRVVSHEGGQTPFAADITAALRPHAAEQSIVVRVEDWPHDLAQPRGKQFWEPESRTIWHPRTTGIWQPVWLEPVSTIHIEDIRWTPDIDAGSLGLQVALNTPPDDALRLRVRLRLRGHDPGGRRVRHRSGELLLRDHHRARAAGRPGEPPRSALGTRASEPDRGRIDPARRWASD